MYSNALYCEQCGERITDAAGEMDSDSLILIEGVTTSAPTTIRIRCYCWRCNYIMKEKGGDIIGAISPDNQGA